MGRVASALAESGRVFAKPTWWLCVPHLVLEKKKKIRSEFFFPGGVSSYCNWYQVNGKYIPGTWYWLPRCARASCAAADGGRHWLGQWRALLGALFVSFSLENPSLLEGTLQT